MYQQVFTQIVQNKIIAILRDIPPTAIADTAQALWAGGIRLVEVTFNQRSDDRIGETTQAIAQIKKRMGDRLFVGAGTVLTAAELHAAADSGAQFVLSPSTQPGLIALTRQLGLVSIPGAYTASEMVTAFEAGATAVKFFPAGDASFPLFQAMIAPLNHIPVIAVGGITLENVQSYLSAGAIAVGIGSNLASPALIQQGQFELLTQRAALYQAQANPA